MEDTAYVYLDIVFFLNFVMDYVILWTTAKFGQLKTTRQRLFLGAFVGAFYSLVLFFQIYNFLFNIFVKIGFSILIVAVTFAPLTPKKFLHAFGYFYLVSFTMGGAMFGGIYLVNKNPDALGMVSGILVLIDDYFFPGLVLAVGLALILARWGSAIKRSIMKNVFMVPLLIKIGSNSLRINGLIDTGNRLIDPLTQNPVIVVEYQVLAGLLPEELKKVFQESEPDLQRLTASLTGNPWSTRLRVIPFSSLGKKHGMLLGFRPDEVIIESKEGFSKTKDVIIALYGRRLCPKGSYQALLHPDILHVH